MIFEGWVEVCARAGIELGAERAAMLERYLELLIEGNTRINLTRIDDLGRGRVEHVADALVLLEYLPAGACRVADVGSGGGVPGIPLAIVRGDARVTLIESTGKKAEFLAGVVRELGLKNCEVVNGRAEDFKRMGKKGNFEVVVARAVARMKDLAGWCLPLVGKGGVFLAMKGPRVAEELEECGGLIRRLGGGGAAVYPAGLEGLNHVVVEIIKT